MTGLPRRLLRFAALFSILLTAVLCLAEEPADSGLSYEVKFLLDSEKVLGTDHLLKDEIKELFGIADDSEDYPDEYEEIYVLYLETADRAFIGKNWINRIRWRGSKKKPLERTYKKRYPDIGETRDDILAALEKAQEDGFSLGGDYEAQIDWGYSKMALSFSQKTKEKAPEGFTSLSKMNTGDAVAYMSAAMPEKEKAAAPIQKAQKTDTIHVFRIEGVFRGSGTDTDVTIEVWPYFDRETRETAYITELSFEAEKSDFQTVADTRMGLEDYLNQKGILLCEDSLKTTLILKAHIRTYPEKVGFTLPAALTKIGGSAFAGCPAESVLVPDETKQIAGDAFAGAEDLIVIGALNSAADTFANQNAYSFIPE